MVSARNGRSHGLDEISQVLGDGRYSAPFYDDDLRLASSDLYSRQRIAVSRFYMLLRPPVVVDFEPGDGPFHFEQKQRHFSNRGNPLRGGVHWREANPS